MGIAKTVLLLLMRFFKGHLIRLLLVVLGLTSLSHVSVANWNTFDYGLVLNANVQNDSLVIQLGVKDATDPFAFVGADLILGISNINHLDMANAKITDQGFWSQETFGPDFEPIVLGAVVPASPHELNVQIKVSNTVDLNMDPPPGFLAGPGTGLDSVFLAEVSIPLSKNCYNDFIVKYVKGKGAIMAWADFPQKVFDVSSQGNFGSVTVPGVSASAGFSGLEPEYCTSSFLSQLVPQVEGGVFSGNGVKYDVAGDFHYFDPYEAGEGTHQISYKICGKEQVETVQVYASPCNSTVSSATSSVAIASPQGIATDCDGNIFVSSRTISGDYVIYRIDNFGQKTEIVNNLNGAVGVSLDPSGNLYVVETVDDWVRKIDYNAGTDSYSKGATYSLLLGGELSADHDFLGLTIDDTHTFLYTSDSKADLIRELDLSNGNVRTVAGGGGEFTEIHHLAYDDGKLYVADKASYSIKEVDVASGVVTTVTGSTPGYSDGTLASAQFISPVGVAVDGQGRLFVSDDVTHVVRQVDYLNDEVTTIQGSAFSTISPGDLNGPTAVSAFIRGFVDIADTKNDEVRRVQIEDYLRNPFDSLNSDYCLNDLADTLNPTTVDGYYTSDAGLISKTADNNYWVFNPTVAGTHKLYFHHTLGVCKDSVEFEVNVHGLPVPNLGADYSICPPSLNKDTVSAGSSYTSYSWQFTPEGGGSTIALGTDTFEVVTDYGRFDLSVVDTNGCQGAGAVSVSGFAGVEFALAGEDTLCYGDSTEIEVIRSAGSTGPAYASYEWNTGETTSKITADATGEYVVKVTDNDGCWAYDTLALHVHDPIYVNIDSVDHLLRGKQKLEGDTLLICDFLNADYTFSAVASGGSGAFQYAWWIQAKDLVVLSPDLDTTKTSFDVTATSPIPRDAPIFLKATDVVSGCEVWDTVTLYLNSLEAEIIAQHNIICPGMIDTLEAQVIQGPSLQYNYKWTGDASSTGTATVKDSLAIIQTTNEGVKRYFLTVEDVDKKCRAKDTLEITVRKPVASLEVISDISCDSSMMVDMWGYNSEGVVPFTSGDALRYSWSIGSPSTSYFVAGDDSSSAVAIQGGTPGSTTKIYMGMTDSLGIELAKQGRADSLTCWAYDSAEVYWNPPMSVQATQDTFYICTPSSGQLLGNTATGGTPGYNHCWGFEGTAPATMTLDTLTGEISGIDNDTAQVIYHAYDKYYCYTADTVTAIAVSFQVEAVAKYDSICAGLGDSLFANVLNDGKGGFTYSWTPASNVDDASKMNPVATLQNTTTFEVEVTDAGTQCKATVSKEVEVIDFVAVAGANGVLDTLQTCFDQPTVKLDASNTYGGFGGNTFAWTSDDLQVLVADADSVIAEASDNGVVRPSYSLLRVNVQDSIGCKAEDSIVVAWNEQLQTVVSDTVYLCGGSAKQLTVNNTTGGVADYNYSWSLLTSNSASASIDASGNVSVMDNDTATVVVKAIDAVGCETTDTAVVIGLDFVVEATAQYDTTCAELDNVLDVSTANDGKGLFNYAWTPASSLDVTNSKNPVASPTATTMYKVLVTDLGTGCQAEDSVQVVIEDFIAVAGDLNVVDTIMACYGVNEVSLKATNTYGGDGNYTYNWSTSASGADVKNGTLDLDQLLDNGVSRPSISEVYLEVKDGIGCTSKDSLYVDWRKALVVNAVDDTLYICTPNEAVLIPGVVQTGANYHVKWLPSSSAPSSVNLSGNKVTALDNDTAQVYLQLREDNPDGACYGYDTVTVIGVNFEVEALTQYDSLCAGLENQLEVNVTDDQKGPLTYVWSPAGDLDDASIANPLATVNATTTYKALVTDNGTGCQAEDSVSVKVIDFQAVTGVDTLLACYGVDTLALDGTSTFGGDENYSFAWSTADANINIDDANQALAEVIDQGVTRPTQSTIYLDVTDGIGCTSRDSLVVDWREVLPLEAMDDTLYVCTPNSAQLEIKTVPTSGNYSLKWGMDASAPAGMYLSGNNVVWAQDNDTSFAYVTLTDSNSTSNCQNFDTVTVIGVHFELEAVTQYDSLCSGLENQLEVNVVDDQKGPLTYTWSPAGDLDDASISNPLATVKATTTYKVLITDNGTGCEAEDSVSVRVNDFQAVAGDANVVDTIMACYGVNEVSLKAINTYGGDGNYTYKWSSSASGADVKDGSLDLDQLIDNGVSRPSITKVSLEVTDGIGCTSKDSLYVDWRKALVVNAVDDTLYICTPDEAELIPGVVQTGANYHVDWVPSSSAPSSVIVSNNKVTALDNDTAQVYLRLTEVNPDGACFGYDTVTVIGVNFVVEATSQFDSLCAGLDSQLEVAVVDDQKGPLTYTWTPNADLDDVTIANPVATINATTTYKAVVTDQGTGCEAEDSVLVKVIEFKAVAGEADMLDTLVACYGIEEMQVDASNTFGGDGNYNFTWSTLEADLTLTDEATVLAKVKDQSVTRPHYSLIQLEVTDGTGCKDNDSLYVYWNSQLTLDTDTVVYVCVGENDTLNTSVTGGAGSYEYGFIENSGSLPLVSDVDGQMIIDGSQAQSPVTITRFAEDLYGCPSDSIEVAISFPELKGALTLDYPVVCPEISVTAKVDQLVADDVASLKYSWDGSTFGYADSLVFDALNDTTVQVVVKDTLRNCMTQMDVDLMIKELVTDIDTSYYTKLCFEDEMILSSVSDGGTGVYTYEWKEDGVDFLLDTIALQVNPPAQGLDTASRYSLTVKDETGCTVEDSIDVYRNHEIKVTLGRMADVCLGDTIQLRASAKGGSGADSSLTESWEDFGVYNIIQEDTLWKLIGDEADDYYVRAVFTDSLLPRCYGLSAWDTVVVHKLPEMSLPDTLAFCENESVQVNPVAEDSLTYLWSTGSTDSMIVVNLSGTYDLSVTDSLTGCSISDTVEVIEKELPVVTLDSLPAYACGGVPLALTASASTVGGTYTWELAQGKGRIDSTGLGQTIYWPEIGQTTSVGIRVLYDDGCVASDSSGMDVAPNPEVEILASDTLISFANNHVNYEGNLLVGTDVTWNWEFEGGDLLDATTVGPHDIAYDIEGTYHTTLTVTEKETGCVDMDTVQIRLADIRLVYVPNAFSPYATMAENQTLKVYGTGLSDENFRFVVYDRWGHVVYETDSYDVASQVGWDGTGTNGEMQVLGVYTYVLEGQYNNGISLSQAGTVNLMK